MQDCAADPVSRALSERLRVVSVAADRLQVLVDRTGGCAACSAQKGCGAAAHSTASRPELLTLARPPGLVVARGDEVEVSLPAGALLGAVWLAYLLPAIAFVVALSAGTAAGLSDLWSGVVAVAVLALSFLPLILSDRRTPLADEMEILAVHPASGALHEGR